MTIMLQVFEQVYSPSTPWQQRKVAFVDADHIVAMRLDGQSGVWLDVTKQGESPPGHHPHAGGGGRLPAQRVRQIAECRQNGGSWLIGHDGVDAGSLHAASSRTPEPAARTCPVGTVRHTRCDSERSGEGSGGARSNSARGRRRRAGLRVGGVRRGARHGRTRAGQSVPHRGRGPPRPGRGGRVPARRRGLRARMPGRAGLCVRSGLVGRSHRSRRPRRLRHPQRRPGGRSHPTSSSAAVPAIASSSRARWPIPTPGGRSRSPSRTRTLCRSTTCIRSRRRGTWAPRGGRSSGAATSRTTSPTTCSPSVVRNQAKRDATPSGWLPSDPAYHCFYVGKFLGVAVRYGLPITAADRDAIAAVAADCG